MSDWVSTAVVGGVLELTLNRPAKRNALTQDMYGALSAALDRVDGEPGLRVLLITGAGDFFTAGNDIGDFLGQDVSATEAPVVRFLYTLAQTDVPVVAAVNGSAVGVGVTMLFHCDFVYASADALFSTPFIDLALVPEAASSLTMPAQMGYRRAAEMLLLGETYSAEQMVQCGVLNATVDGEQLLSHARTVAQRLAKKPGSALRASKRLMRRAPESRTERIAVELEAFGQALASPEAGEAMTAFVEKRQADFTRFE